MRPLDVERPMARRPKEPRYFPSRKAYYVQVDGKQILLAKGEPDDPEVLAKALEQFRAVIPARASRVVAITEKEYERISWHAGSYGSTVFSVLHRTGCRPAEVCTLTAADLHPEVNAVAVGNRWITCDKDIFEKLKLWTRFRPNGPLLCNRRGKALTVDAIHAAFIRLRDRLGLRGAYAFFLSPCVCSEVLEGWRFHHHPGDPRHQQRRRGSCTYRELRMTPK